MPRKAKGIPANFEELMRVYPTLVRHIVYNFLCYNVSIEKEIRAENAYSEFEADIDEYMQDVLLHLMALAPTSKYRAEGFTDRIELYDPSLCPVSMKPIQHFKVYLTTVIKFYLSTRIKNKRLDALSRTTQPFADTTLVVNPEPRMTRSVLINELCGYISEARKGDREGKVRGRDTWKSLAKKLGVDPTDERDTRARINNFLVKNAQHFGGI